MTRDDDPKMTRRQALIRGSSLTLATGLGLAGLTAGCDRLASSTGGQGATTSSPASKTMASKTGNSRMPTVFLPHGGGPWPFMDESVFGAPGMWDAMRQYMEGLGMVAPTRPRAVLMISAHWEAPRPTLMTSKAPPMLYDYQGFPPETYEIDWPAPGSPEVAERVRELLVGAGFAPGADPSRGFDHGTFVPMMLAYPDADIPTFQLSLVHGLDPQTHVQIGRALAPLRQEGVLLVGSGMSYHNMRAFFGPKGPNTAIENDSRAFDDWLAESVIREASSREARLVEWERAPAARACHPREEHLLPLMVVAGAAEDDPGTLPYRDRVMGAYVSAVHFGAG